MAAILSIWESFLCLLDSLEMHLILNWNSP